jgi:uncharacterized protein (TIGR02284 family)
MNNHDTKVLETLITTTIDSADGFADAAADAGDPRLKSIFSAFATERREIAERLRADAARLGGEASAEGSLKAAAHRRWMDLKNALTKGDEAVLGSVEAGETYLRTKYEAALADDRVSDATREAVTDAFVSVARGQARVIELRRCLGLSQPRRSTDWSRVGTGLGTAAVLAGVAYVATQLSGPSRRKPGGRPLQVDEDARLISSKKVEGTPVVSPSGVRLGTIDSFMVDKYTGEVAYAVMSHGGTLGLGGDLLPLPWALLAYDVDKGGYVIDMSTEELAQAPRYEAEDDPEFSAAYRQRISRYFGAGERGRYAH